MNHKGDFLSLLKHADTLKVDGEQTQGISEVK